MTEKDARAKKSNPFGTEMTRSSIFRTDTFDPREEPYNRQTTGRRADTARRTDDLRETEHGYRKEYGRETERKETDDGYHRGGYGRRPERPERRYEVDGFGREQRTENGFRRERRTEEEFGRERRTEEGFRRERRTEDGFRRERGTEDGFRRERGTEDGFRRERKTEEGFRRERKETAYGRKTDPEKSMRRERSNRTNEPRHMRGYHVGSPDGEAESRPGPWLRGSSGKKDGAGSPEKRDSKGREPTVPRTTGVFAKVPQKPITAEEMDRAVRERRDRLAGKAADEKDNKTERRQPFSKEAFESQKTHPVTDFLPMSKEEAAAKGWDELDIILITGDAYVDHSGFGTAIIGRVLEDAGFRVGVIAQPDIRSDEAFRVLGKPKLFFSISAGNADSLVNNYTPLLYPRKTDAYSPGGRTGLRPDRAVISYSNRVHQIYPDVPIVAGGIEASLRRFAEFDYLSNKVRQSVLADAPVDLIVYGMGELQIAEIAKRLGDGEKIETIRDIPGTVWKMPVKEWKFGRTLPPEEIIELPSYTEVAEDKKKYAEAFRTIYENLNHVTGKTLVQVHPKTVIAANKPMRPLTTAEMDRVYELPYTREAHPSYDEPVPGLNIVRLSLTTHRGCFGGCSFCAIAQHQGIEIANRSEGSLLREAAAITKLPGFNGIINGVGGPSANMYGMSCPNWEKRGPCMIKNCLTPKLCPSMKADHAPILSLLEKLRNVPGVRKVLTGYGVRFDLAVLDDEYMETLCRYHVGGQLKVAPEHFCDNVTARMRKPGHAVFEAFEKKYRETNEKIGLPQYLVTFQISGHPGSTLDDAVAMAEYIRDHNRYTEQVQDFTPTPMTISTCMFHTGLDPFTMEPVYVPATRTEKKMQRALLQYKAPQNYDIVKRALIQAGRRDLIGSGPKCLIPRDPPADTGFYDSDADRDD